MRLGQTICRHFESKLLKEKFEFSTQGVVSQIKHPQSACMSGSSARSAGADLADFTSLAADPRMQYCKRSPLIPGSWICNISDPDNRQGTCIKRSNERKNRACFMHELRQGALLATIVGCMLLRYAVRICASEGGHQFQHLHSLFGSVLYYFWWCQHYIYVLDVYNISPQLGLPD